ncbi:MAG: hypothetical protein EA398_08130 [Deltaproteobacteria bacterium]|nr:MAG: hypothetical protein EA398_08130 [Deltaproteobacteria bacterium]
MRRWGCVIVALLLGIIVSGAAGCGACPEVERQWNDARRQQLAAASAGRALDSRGASHIELSLRGALAGEHLRERLAPHLEGERRRRVVLDAELDATRAMLTLEVDPVVADVRLADGESGPVVEVVLEVATRSLARAGGRERASTGSTLVTLELPLRWQEEDGAIRVDARLDQAVFPPPALLSGDLPRTVARAAGDLLGTMLQQRILEDPVPVPVLELRSSTLDPDLVVHVDELLLAGDAARPDLVLVLRTNLYPRQVASGRRDREAMARGVDVRVDFHPGLLEAGVRDALFPGGVAVGVNALGEPIPGARRRLVMRELSLEADGARLALSVFRPVGRCSACTVEVAAPVAGLDTPDAGVVEVEIIGRSAPVDVENLAGGAIVHDAMGHLERWLDGGWIRLPSATSFVAPVRPEARQVRRARVDATHSWPRVDFVFESP